MNVVFYNNTSSNNTLDKTLTEIKTSEVNFLDSVDIINPIIKTVDFPTNSNYCYITTLNRYYFINDVKILQNNLFCLYLDIDILNSYKTDIKNLSLHCVETDDITDCLDVDYIESDELYTNETNINDVFTDESFLLMTVVG